MIKQNKILYLKNIEQILYDLFGFTIKYSINNDLQVNICYNENIHKLLLKTINVRYERYCEVY